MRRGNSPTTEKPRSRTINTKKLVNAASDVAKAVTLSDEDVAAMARELINTFLSKDNNDSLSQEEGNPQGFPSSSFYT